MAITTGTWCQTDKPSVGAVTEARLAGMRQRELTWSGCAFEISKSISSDTLPSTRPCLIILPQTILPTEGYAKHHPHGVFFQYVSFSFPFLFLSIIRWWHLDVFVVGYSILASILFYFL